jgi:hypothetical protein
MSQQPLFDAEAKINNLDGDQVMDLIDLFIRDSADQVLAPLKDQGWTEDELIAVGALIKTAAQKYLINGITWRGEVKPTLRKS